MQPCFLESRIALDGKILQYVFLSAYEYLYSFFIWVLFIYFCAQILLWPQHILTDCQPEFSNFNTITIYMNVKNHLKDLICSDKQA